MFKGALYPNFLNLPKKRKKFSSRKVLVPILNLLLLKNFIFNVHSKVLLGSGVIFLIRLH